MIHVLRRAAARPAAIGAVAMAMWLACASAAEASNDALLRLLQVLRDRGSISSAEYDEIRLVAKASDASVGEAADPAAVGEPPRLQQAALRTPATAQPTAPIAVQQAAPGASAAPAAPAPLSAQDLQPIVNRALANKWYEKIGLRGYTQFRAAEVGGVTGPPLEVPADRSVNENESFIIRRGRFVFSGDPAQHLALYAQMDFNGSTGTGDFSLQMRDLYADVSLDANKAWRMRFGQSKVPFGWVNMQSSQNRAPLERPDALNSAVEGERDLGAFLMYASPEARSRFRDLTALGLKGSGDYGVVSVGAYAGEGLNRSDQNGQLHLFGRVTYPFKLASGQFFELGLQGYSGRFVSPTQAITIGNASVTPAQRSDGELDQRVAATFVWYPQPVGVEMEWTSGRGPALSSDMRSIGLDSLNGGYVQVNYRTQYKGGTWFPFTRWNYFDGYRKFARNAPRDKVNELDFGLEFAPWTEVEITGMFSHTFTRTRTGSFPYVQTTGANRFGVQVQWNY